MHTRLNQKDHHHYVCASLAYHGQRCHKNNLNPARIASISFLIYPVIYTFRLSTKLLVNALVVLIFHRVSLPHHILTMPNEHQVANGVGGAHSHPDSKTQPAIEFAHQAERLAQYTVEQEEKYDLPSTQAVEAKFVTAQDPVIETANGGRLPAVPIDEALKLNQLKDQLEDRETNGEIPVPSEIRKAKDGTVHGLHREAMGSKEREAMDNSSARSGATLNQASVPSRTSPLFPPLPTFGPSRTLRIVHCWFFRCTSSILSFLFLLIIVLGAAFTSMPMLFKHIRMRLTFQNPSKERPFFEEENRRRKARKAAEKKWQESKKKDSRSEKEVLADLERDDGADDFVPIEGGPDPIICDIGYYARRVGLDSEKFDVETEDGFIIELWHVYNPREYQAAPEPAHNHHGHDVFHSTPSDPEFGQAQSQYADGNKKYPVLMIHGLLQSAGAYCCTDDDSLAFYLAKSGYDVWLGNNRCGFNPRHVLLEYSDPRMWAWNIRQMGVMDLPALVSRVLAETGFPKLGLVCHSQGTTQTLVALAKEQRPEIGEKISVFCALAPAAYAGPLIGKAYFKFMYIITANMFRCVFGIHAFIPFMMEMHKILPAGLYGTMGYRVFSFLFNWSDTRWEKDLRNRMFQFAPVYVSAESMRWWLGRECFARQKCILATREEGMMEDEEDEEEDEFIHKYYEGHHTDTEQPPQKEGDHAEGGNLENLPSHDADKERGQFAWYNEQFPPIALWVCGADDLVDGRRLLRRFDRGREPHVNVVYKKIIEGYEHLDVIWSMDVIEKVGKGLKEVIWKTASEEARAICRTPTGCEDVDAVDVKKRVPSTTTNGVNESDRRGSSDLAIDLQKANGDATLQNMQHPVSPTQIDSTAGEWTHELREDARKIRADEDGKRA